MVTHKWIRGKGNVHDVQRDRVNEPHTDTMQGKEHSTCMGPHKEPMATQEHAMA